MWHERLPLLWGVEVKGSTVSKRGVEEGIIESNWNQTALSEIYPDGVEISHSAYNLVFHLQPSSQIPILQKVSAHRPRPSHFFIFFISHEMIHTDNLGSAVRSCSSHSEGSLVELGSLNFFFLLLFVVASSSLLTTPPPLVKKFSGVLGALI